MGRFIVCWLMLLDVRFGYDGLGGAGASGGAIELDDCGLGSADALLLGDLSRSFSLTDAVTEGGAAGAGCDLRLLCSSIPTAQASRSTGVRLAACKKASCSCDKLVYAHQHT
jgi:hypothetical protein